MKEEPFDEEKKGIGKMELGKMACRIERISRPKLVPEKLQLAYFILEECTKDLIYNSHDYWDIDRLPSKFETMMKQDDIRLVYIGESPVATFTLLDMPPEEIRKYWGRKADEPAAYMRALAVVPDRQGRGIGQKLVGQIERIVLEEKKQNILRFHAADVLKDYFHGKLGYPVYKEYETGKRYNLVMFEKMLNKK